MLKNSREARSAGSIWLTTDQNHPTVCDAASKSPVCGAPAACLHQAASGRCAGGSGRVCQRGSAGHTQEVLHSCRHPAADVRRRVHRYGRLARCNAVPSCRYSALVSSVTSIPAPPGFNSTLPCPSPCVYSSSLLSSTNDKPRASKATPARSRPSLAGTRCVFVELWVYRLEILQLDLEAQHRLDECSAPVRLQWLPMARPVIRPTRAKYDR